jgi:hypothetical protein
VAAVAAVAAVGVDVAAMAAAVAGVAGMDECTGKPVASAFTTRLLGCVSRFSLT